MASKNWQSFLSHLEVKGEISRINVSAQRVDDFTLIPICYPAPSSSSLIIDFLSIAKALNLCLALFSPSSARTNRV